MSLMQITTLAKAMQVSPRFINILVKSNQLPAPVRPRWLNEQNVARALSWFRCGKGHAVITRTFPRDWLTVADAAPMLGVSIGALYSWVRDNDPSGIPYYRFSARCIRFRVGELSRWMRK